MSEESLKEKRRATRYKANANMKIILNDDQAFDGALKDVSRIGAFVFLQGAQEDWVLQNCRFEMTAQVASETLFITGECVIVRATEKGVGIFINNIDSSARMHFVKFISEVQKPENEI